LLENTLQLAQPLLADTLVRNFYRAVSHLLSLQLA
jgi:hypothetical protein